MDKLTSFIDLQTLTSEPIILGSTTVTPTSCRLSLSLPQCLKPNKGLVFIHQRPTNLVVKNGQKTEIVPVIDITRICLAFFSMFGALFVAMHKKKKHTY